MYTYIDIPAANDEEQVDRVVDEEVFDGVLLLRVKREDGYLSV
jgi:hypothetical protein